MWPEEAWRIRQAGRLLTELAGVRPWIASKLKDWSLDPPEFPEPPPIRSGFRSSRTRGGGSGTSGSASAPTGRVAERAAALDVALEIDAYPDRQDLDVALLAHVKRAGGRVSIGTDAHNAEELRYLDVGVAAAISAKIPRDRILNCMAPDELVAWTRSQVH